jgi:hypothetical protein
MRTNKTRLMAISGTTLALVVATTGAVSARPGDRFEDDGARKGRVGAELNQRFGEGRGDRGANRGGMFQRGAIRGAQDDFERRETTIQTADGTTSHRVEQGTLDGASDTGLEFTLTSGETVTVTIDADTQAVAFSEESVENRRGFSHDRMVPTEVEVGDIPAGSEIVVWSGSEDGGDFVADRVVVQPDVEEATDVEAEAEAVDADAATVAPATDA